MLREYGNIVANRNPSVMSWWAYCATIGAMSPPPSSFELGSTIISSLILKPYPLRSPAISEPQLYQEYRLTAFVEITLQNADFLNEKDCFGAATRRTELSSGIPSREGA
ncbi:MAG: hypothetical protein R3B51_00040 [Thermodesulfobacteriota bacterium]